MSHELKRLAKKWQFDVEEMRHLDADRKTALSSGKPVIHSKNIIFVGTTGFHQPIPSPSVQRRFWPIQVGHFFGNERQRSSHDFPLFPLNSWFRFKHLVQTLKPAIDRLWRRLRQ